MALPAPADSEPGPEPNGPPSPENAEQGLECTSLAGGEAFEACAAFPGESAAYINYKSVLALIEGDTLAQAQAPGALEVEVDKAATFVTNKLADLEGVVEASVGGERAETPTQTSGGVAASWAPFQERGSTAARVHEIEVLYLRLAEVVQFTSFNCSSAQSLQEKITQLDASKAFGDCLALQTSLQRLAAVRQRTRDLQEGLASAHPNEDLVWLRHEAPILKPKERGCLWDHIKEHKKEVVAALAVILLLCFARYAPGLHDGGVSPAALRLIAQKRVLIMIFAASVLVVLDVMPLFLVAAFLPPMALAFGVFVLPNEPVGDQILSLLRVYFDEMVPIFFATQLIELLLLKCQVGARAVNLFLRAGVSASSAPFLLLLISLTAGLGALCQSGIHVAQALTHRLRGFSGGEEKAARPILLGAMFAGSFGTALLPFSNLLVLSAMFKFGIDIPLWKWACVAIPCVILLCFILWGILLLHPGLPKPPEGGWPPMAPYKLQALTISQMFSLTLTGLFIAVWALIPLLRGYVNLNPLAGSYIGHYGCLALLFSVIVLVLGLVRLDELSRMNWRLLFCIAASNAICFLLRHVGNLDVVGQVMVSKDEILTVFVWMGAAKIAAILVVCSSLFGNAVTMVFIMPIVCSLAMKMYAAHLVMLVAVLAISVSVAFTCSTNQNHTVSLSARNDLQDQFVPDREVWRVGVPVTFCGLLVTVTAGFWMGIGVCGFPPPHIHAAAPGRLQPSFRHYAWGDAMDAKLDHLERRYRELHGGDLPGAAPLTPDEVPQDIMDAGPALLQWCRETLATPRSRRFPARRALRAGGSAAALAPSASGGDASRTRWCREQLR